MSKLVIEERGHEVRLFWWIPEDGDTGGALGACGEERFRVDCSDAEKREMAIAFRTARANWAFLDGEGLYWETEPAARKALKAIKDAWRINKSERPWPQWAKDALAAGWKAPKGWSP